jgi:hypothetical protein
MFRKPLCQGCRKPMNLYGWKWAFQVFRNQMILKEVANAAHNSQRPMSGGILKGIFPQGRSKKMKAKLMAVIVLGFTCAATAFGQCYGTTAYGTTVAVPCAPVAPVVDNTAALASLMTKPQAWQAFAAGAEVARQRALAQAAIELARQRASRTSKNSRTFNDSSNKRLRPNANGKMICRHDGLKSWCRRGELIPTGIKWQAARRYKPRRFTHF